MSAARRTPDRIHLLAHANPATKDIERFGFRDARAMIDFVREHTPPAWRITANAALFEAQEDQSRGGRRDDAAREFRTRLTIRAHWQSLRATVARISRASFHSSTSRR